MAHRSKPPRYRALIVSLTFSVVIICYGLYAIETINITTVTSRLLWPLSRLILLIMIGLIIGQAIEASGWTRYLATLARPIFRFGNLGDHCSAAFMTAFFSGTAANAMLLEFYEECKITKKQLYLTNFVNHFPGYFLHLPTTFFIIVPLTGIAGGLYLLITFLSMLIRTTLLLFYGHVSVVKDRDDCTYKTAMPRGKTFSETETIWQAVKRRLPARLIGVAIYVIPIYIIVFMLNAVGIFEKARDVMAQFVVTSFIPMESLSLVILSFVAEFTSGFAAAGALLDSGVLTIKQTVIALLIGNILAFPMRALRHQLPRYMGIFSPKMGAQILLMGQGFRIISLIVAGAVYYWVA